VLLRDQGLADAGLLRALAGRLAARPDVVAFCGAKVDGAAADWTVVVQRGAASSFDCGAWFKRAVAACGGRGGGRAERAEGRLGGTSIDALARLG
jgi:alanyl-tRNA synthetase